VKERRAMDIRKKYYQMFIDHPKANDYHEFHEFGLWCRTVWFYPTGDQIRLNWFGVGLFSEMLPSYEVWIPEDRRKSKHYLFLNRYCKEPYYIEPGKAVFFNENEAMVFKLCDGDLDNLEPFI
jgi:hypothetical protein